MKTPLILVACTIASLAGVGEARAFEPATVRAFESLAIQDGGRLKPLATYARFTLLRLSGRTTVPAGEETLSATEWLVDCLFRPQVAAGYKVFLVDDPEVMDALGLRRTAKRDRYSYNDLRPARAALLELARQYAGQPPENREHSETQLLRLAENFLEYEALTAGDGGAARLALVPPGNPARTDWLTPAEALQGGAGEEPARLAAQFAELAAAAEDPARFGTAARAFASAARTAAGARGQDGRVALEVWYYRLQVLGVPVFYGLARALYMLAFLAAALFWLRPRSRATTWVVPGLLAAPTLILAAGIALRCVIRQRPPVTTLYETILFVTVSAVVVALAAEWATRRRVALSLAPVIGALGLFLAGKHEAIEGVDTMPALVAVLDTNFWLSTHVTTITLGYAAGLLAAAIAHVFVAAKLLGLKRDEPEFYAAVTRTVYGVLCFGLLFSTVGTVLGGIWAAESWGRFWGWDPKENGALLIVLWGLLIVHARLGGYIRDYGINLAALVGGMVVAFSWFGVNLLGVGLHSYGFTNGAFTGLVIFYGLETVVLLAGFAAWLWEELLPAPVAPEPSRADVPAPAARMGG